MALFVARGGSALAATGQIVNIADPTTAANVAKVDTTGALKTAGSATVSGYVGQTIPKTPFFGHAYLSASGTNTLIAANKAVVAVTRMDLQNYFGQTNGAVADIRLYELGGDATTCNGASKAAGTYEVPAGQTISVAMESPIVLKSLVSGDVWCLLGSVAIQGAPGSYFCLRRRSVVMWRRGPSRLERCPPRPAPRRQPAGQDPDHTGHAVTGRGHRERPRPVAR